MLKLKFTFEMDEEQLREIFDSYDIKFSKKKVKDLQAEMELSLDDVQVEMEDRFAEIVEEWIQNTLD
jgi:hypothetical protein